MRLSRGGMPPDIEDLLAGCKLSLFPASYTDLKASCDCPDAENPCKHIAAVYYLLAERFDADPFLIVTWRGRTQEERLDGLRARRARSKTKGSSASPRTAAGGAEGARSFWESGPELAHLRISPLAGEAPGALLRRVGPAPSKPMDATWPTRWRRCTRNSPRPPSGGR